MTTFLVLAAVAVIGLTAYRFSPTSANARFWPSFRSAHDRVFDTYDDQRLYRELDIMRAHADTAEDVTPTPATPVQYPKTGPSDGNRRGPVAA